MIKSPTHIYQSGDTYGKHVGLHNEEQLENFHFGHFRLSDFIEKAHSLLEVGCGSGILLERLKKKFPFTKMSGVDLNPIGIQMACQRARDKNLAIDFRVADVESTIPFSPDSFDLVVCNAVLGHLTNPEAAIRNMSQMLAPGGLLVLVFPNRWIHWKVQRMVKRSGLQFQYKSFVRGRLVAQK